MGGAKSARTEATKQKLERVARELFAEHGFAGVSAEQVVARADVTRGALYHHYSGKAGLFEAVVEANMREVHDKLVAKVAGALDPLDALTLGIVAFLDVCAEPVTHRLLLIEAPAVLGWNRWREMDAKYGFGLLKGALAAAMRTGQLRRQDVDVLGHVLLGALTELAMMISRSSSPHETRSAAQQAIISMIDGWRR